jgi:Fic family protein
VSTFRDIDRHLSLLPANLVSTLTRVHEARGREQLFSGQHPEGLDVLRKVALIQSAEASNAIEDIRAPRARIEALVAEATEPENRSEAEIAGYRYVLGQLHVSAPDIPFEPRYVKQMHGYLYRFTGDRDAGHFKRLDNTVEERHPDGTLVHRFTPVSADRTPQAMNDLHRGFHAAQGRYPELLLAAAYVLDFLVIHPFRDGNGRMARLITLWLLYLSGHDVGRFISVEKVIETSKETYYDALARSTVGWHESEHDLMPWAGYFLGVLVAVYDEFESRTAVTTSRGSKRALVEGFVRSSMSSRFTVADVREGAPGVSDIYIRRVLDDLKKDGVIEPSGRGAAAFWTRLREDF